MAEDQDKDSLKKRIERARRGRRDSLSKLHDFSREYSADKFISDLGDYFSGEVDFNVAKIKAEVQKEGRLTQLIKRACRKQTHPVVEFIQEIFIDS